jgi:phage terminase large subunit
MDLNLQVTPVFIRNMEADADIVINRGGTRSSKTYSLAQLFIQKLVTEPRKRFLISRKGFPALRISVMNTVISLLKEHGIYRKDHHNKTENTYRYPYTGSAFYFVSIDDEQKIRGPEWNYVWFNEANEMTYDEFKQPYLRLSAPSLDGKPNQFFIDFNPSDPFTWIKSEIEDMNRADVILSTYKDNTFLDPSTVKRIEHMQANDPAFWRVFGLGEYSTVANQIYRPYAIIEAYPDDYSDQFYGLDFGYNHPTALVWIGKRDEGYYLRQLIYDSYLHNSDRIKALKRLKVPKGAPIYADSAEPALIDEIQAEGYNIWKAKKDVADGIDFCQRQRFYCTSENVDLIKERAGYKWREHKNGQILDEPIKFFDDLMDAKRYGVYTHEMSNALIDDVKVF